MTIQVTKWALNSFGITPAPSNDRAYGDHFRVALLELSTPTGLTMEKYRTELDEILAQNQIELDFWLRSTGHSPSTSVISVILPHKDAPQTISTIEEVSEAEGEGSSANGHTFNYGDGGKNSLRRRIFRPSVG